MLSSCHSDHSHELLGCGHDHSGDAKKSSHSHDHKHDHHQDHKLYGVITVRYRSFGEVMRTGGEILPAQGDEHIVVANHDGLVSFPLSSLIDGVSVKKGQHLVTISSGGLVHDNLEAGYLEAKAQYEKAKVDFERAEKLMADNIVSEREYLETKLEFEKSRLTFDNIRRNYDSGGQKMLAPINGFVKKIHTKEGEFVQTGQPLVTISQNKRLVIKADVPQRAIPKLQAINSANFITPYDGRVYSTTELNGKLMSWGKTTPESSFYIPIFFEVDNVGDLIPGTFVEVFLKSPSAAETIAIPISAVMEEFGNHIVYIDNHEGWEKRYIKIDGTDGRRVKVIDGLNVGDHIATKNVSRIKLSQMSGQLPEHAHVH